MAGGANPGGAGGGQRPVVLVQGDDPTLVSQATTEAIARLVGEEDPGLAVEDHGEVDGSVEGVIDACSTPPFLARRRVVVLRQVGRLRAQEVARLVSYLEDPVATTSLVLVGGGGAPSTKLVAAVRRVGQVVDAGAPAGRGRAGWLAERLRRAPVTLDRGAVALVDQHLGEDLGRLAGLLDALTAAYGEGARLDAAAVEAFLGESGAVPPWELTDAIDRGDPEGALGALHRLLGAGQRHPLTVTAILNRHYGGMLALDGSGATTDAQASEVLGIRSTFRAGKLLAQGARLGSGGVARALHLLAAADLDLRGASSLPGPVVLEVLVGRLSYLAPRRSTRRERSRRR
ncbi:MAG TPA: DNA polymerase III subunit delta [Acidimicrobiales bacterium]|nr:DNA polymerase III subunit delta [Acidimicrobiales bacterium]